MGIRNHVVGQFINIKYLNNILKIFLIFSMEFLNSFISGSIRQP